MGDFQLRVIRAGPELQKSRSKNRTYLFGARGFGGKGKSAVLSHLVGCAKKRAKRNATERAAHADTLDSNCREFSETQLNTAQSHYHIHRTVHSVNHSGDIILGGQPRRIQHIGPSFLISLQPLDGVFDVWTAVQIVL